MQNKSIKIIVRGLFFFLGSICIAQTPSALKGSIKNYYHQPLYLFQCVGDTLLLSDSVLTNEKGSFAFKKNLQGSYGMYKVVLGKNQFFYLLLGTGSLEICSLYSPGGAYNKATDSLVVLQSEENKLFYDFQTLQKRLNVANYWLLQMMRLFPLPDPFHKQIEDEYFSRYKAMDKFIKGKSMTGLIALAYYTPLNPDWKQPDPWRDSIIAEHYFDYFNPSDSFYLRTNILSEKMDLYTDLRTNKRDAYGQPVMDENMIQSAANDFLEKVLPNRENLEFCLNYLLKKLNKKHLDNAFLYLYEKYGKPLSGDCGSSNAPLSWAQAKAGVLKGIQTGSPAPDFKISDKIYLSEIQSEYTLILFWASWCPHCREEVPKIKKAIDGYNQKAGAKLVTVAVSLDTDQEVWQKFVTDNNLFSFLNFSEFKSWKSEVVKMYNVYATPTLFLLDRDKKIIARLDDLQQLNTWFKVN